MKHNESAMKTFEQCFIVHLFIWFGSLFIFCFLQPNFCPRTQILFIYWFWHNFKHNKKAINWILLFAFAISTKRYPDSAAPRRSIAHLDNVNHSMLYLLNSFYKPYFVHHFSQLDQLATMELKVIKSINHFHCSAHELFNAKKPIKLFNDKS